METAIINLIVKSANQQFEDKRITAKASWNIKELKGKLSEIYLTSTEEQKLIYSGKLLNDTVVLKDILREYEGQEAHTVHLVFTPKSGARSVQSKIQEKSSVQQSSDMSTSELRQRHTTTAASVTTNVEQQQQQQQSNNIPTSGGYYNSFNGNNVPFDANSMMAQQYAMQAWMQQAYAQYMNQYMNIMSSSTTPDVQQNQQTNYPFMPQMPLLSPSPSSSSPATTSPISTQSPNPETAAASPQVEAQPQNQQPAAEQQQRRFPNIIQDEQENRDWLDILYSMSRLLILMCLVYFYSSPLRCFIVILIGVSIYLYHIYRQNQNRLNNNNTTRVNLNNVRPAPAAAAPQQQPAVANNAENNENNAAESTNSNTDQATAASTSSEANTTGENENESLINASSQQQSNEPQVSMLTVMRTFIVSFVASIIPDHPAM